VAWQQNNGTLVSAYTNRYNVTSGVWGTSQLMESDDTNTATSAKVGFGSDGNGFLIWQQGSNVFARRYTKATDTWARQWRSTVAPTRPPQSTWP